MWLFSDVSDDGNDDNHSSYIIYNNDTDYIWKGQFFMSQADVGTAQFWQISDVFSSVF